MEVSRKIAAFIARYMAIIVLFVAVVALFLPPSFAWIKPSSISWMLGIVMCGMGLNMRFSDFKIVFSHPKDVLIGCAAQFTIMPLIAYFLVKIFSLPPELAIGVILVGCCPGGTASNVITFLAKGDLAMSVGMTGVSTILAPFLTPLLTFLLAGESVDVDVTGMLMSIVEVVFVPIAIGFLINRYCKRLSEAIIPYLPAVSTLAIAAIVGCIISANSARILSSSLVVIAVVILHNILGFGVGFCVARLLHLTKPRQSAVAIEVGMQNSGLAVSLANVHFAAFPMATIPGALFSVWHNFAGALFASVLKRRG